MEKYGGLSEELKKKITGTKIAIIGRLAKTLTFFQRYEFAAAFYQVVPEVKVKSFKMWIEVSFHGCITVK